MKTIYATLITLFILINSSNCLAEGRIATVDVNKVINSYSDSKSKQAELDSMSKKAKEKVKQKQASLKVMEQDIQSKKLSSSSKEVEKLKKDAFELQKYIRQTESEIKSKYVKINKELTDRAVNAISAYAKSKNYDLVFNKSSDNPGPVLFGSDQNDITNEVIKNL